MTFKEIWKTYFSVLLLRGGQRFRKFALRLADLVLFSISLYLAIALRFESLVPHAFFIENTWSIIVLIPIQLLAFNASGIYRSILRYSSLTLVKDVSKAVGLSAVLSIAIAYFLREETLSRSILIIDALLVLVLATSMRLALRSIVRECLAHSKQQISNNKLQRVLIYGAGGAGAELFHALFHSPLYSVVGFADDHPNLQKKVSIEGLRIYAPDQLDKLWATGRFDFVVLAMPSVSALIRKQIAERLQAKGIPVKTVPSLSRILSGKVTIQELQDIDIADLLGREEVSPDLELLKRQIKNNAVLVTGAGGSIGSELCRQIVRQQPKCLILYERNEFALYSIHQELSETNQRIQIVPCLGSVTDGHYLSAVLNQHQVKTVYHAAAYKHVPLLESNISRGIENNVFGTLTAARSAIASGVSQFVLISTDKAVRPTNIMGTTKRVAELIVQALASQQSARQSLQRQLALPSTSDNAADIRFAIVRFGNVLGSSGSVVPRFRKQIAQGGPITLTHRDITRYFMSIPEAARLVIQAGSMSRGGEVFLLDMGDPIKIYDLAARMISLSGLIPEEDIQIKITGLRPGEKLYEELLISGDNVGATYHPKIFFGQEDFLSWEDLSPRLNLLLEKARANNVEMVRAILRLLVPEYNPQNAMAAPTERQQASAGVKGDMHRGRERLKV